MIYLSPVSDQRGSRANLAVQLSNPSSSQTAKKYTLWTLVDEPKFAQQTNQTTVLKFTGELTLEPVNTATTG